MTIFNTTRKNIAPVTTHAAQPMRLVRRFVETGDERCPIAGIWLSIADSDQQTEDPELARPAMRKFHFLWRAFFLNFIQVRYSIA